MRIREKLALLTAVVALAAAPAAALAAGPGSETPAPPSSKGTAHRTSDPSTGRKPGRPGPEAGLPAKAKAYGRYCRGASKRHVAGQKGTPFSRCVTAMAKLASGRVDDPRNACKGESKKHVAGRKRTPFSECVSAAAKLRHDESSDDDSSSDDQPSDSSDDS